MIASRPVTCLTYHHIAASATAGTQHLGSTTSPDAFARQLDYVQQHYNVIDLDRLLANDIPNRAAMITFDDAAASVARIAAPMLGARQLPSVFFVNPGPVALRMVPIDILASLMCTMYGVAELSRVGSDGAFSAATFGDFMDGFVATLDFSALQVTKTRLLLRLGQSEAEVHAALDLFLTQEDLAALPLQGMEIANHTLSHVHCGRLNGDELAGEITDAKVLLESIIDRPVRAFAFPWGRQSDATDAALQVIRSSGHRATFLMHGRNNTHRPANDMWYRVLATNETGLKLRTTLDVLPRLREWRQRVQGLQAAMPGRRPALQPNGSS